MNLPQRLKHYAELDAKRTHGTLCGVMFQDITKHGENLELHKLVPQMAADLQTLAGLVETLASALLGEIQFREICRNFDPTIEDLKDWEPVNAKSESAFFGAYREIMGDGNE